MLQLSTHTFHKLFCLGTGLLTLKEARNEEVQGLVLALWVSIGSEFWHRLWPLMVTLARIGKSNMEKVPSAMITVILLFSVKLTLLVLLGIGVNEG